MTVVVVSWVLVLLAVFGLNYAHDVLAESRLIHSETEKHQLQAWARSGVELAKITLENTTRVDCSPLGYLGPDNPFALSMACGLGHFAVGHTHSFAGQDNWLPGIHDESGRLPVALMDSTTLAKLPGMTKHGVKVLMAARQSAGENRLPPFHMLTDLDQTSLESAELFMSRYGNSVNVNTASAEVLMAVGLPVTLTRKLLEVRAGKDNIPGTTDDEYFHSLESQAPMVRACSLNSEEAAILAFLYGKKILAVESRFFHLESRGWGEGFAGICEIRVVLEKPEQGPVKVMEWTENWLN